MVFRLKLTFLAGFFLELILEEIQKKENPSSSSSLHHGGE
jgi:hypothetical protein